MQVKANLGIKIHNRFDFDIKDASTGETIQKAQAENIVLDRMYDRLLAYGSYFNNIVFGSGTGTLDPSRTTLFSRIGNKAASTESLVRSYPTSVWTKSIRLGVDEYNGNTLREIGISETTTNINTHALITDSEGNPLEVEKTALKIIDIYATVFVEVYSVDSGCFFYGNGLRDYLTGGSAPGNTIALSGGLKQDDYGGFTITGTKSTNPTEKSVSISGRFGVDDYNRDVGAIDWHSLGLRWKVPRTGVYTGTSKTNVELGTGDGMKDSFLVPNVGVTSLVVRVDGSIVSNYTYNLNSVIFDSPPANGLLVTADYTTKYIPKDINHVLDVTMKIIFGGSQPSPVAPDPVIPNDLPGPQTLSGGDESAGYFGEVSAIDLISGEELCNEIGLTAGILQESDAGWLKYYNNNEILYVAKRTFRHTISWIDINAVGAIFGDKKIAIGNHVYAVRALSTGEWNKLIYPVHVNYGTWANFTDADLRVASRDGSATWTSTPSGGGRAFRGFGSVEGSSNTIASGVDSNIGFRPVLVYLYSLSS